jgi:hypothetical protein
LTQGEELIHETLKGNKNQTNRPGAKRPGWGRCVVLVAYDGSDFCIGRVEGQESHFGLYVGNICCVSVRFFKDFWMLDKVGKTINGLGVEIGVSLVEGDEILGELFMR